MPFFCSLFVHNGPPTCLCVPKSASISSWALNHLSQLVLIMTTLTTCDDIMNNLSTFSQLVLIMIHIATDSCLLSLFSCRLHGWNYAIGYIIKRHHSKVGVSKRCEGFVAIWLRACEDIAANRFQLLFINIDKDIITNCHM